MKRTGAPEKLDFKRWGFSSVVIPFGRREQRPRWYVEYFPEALKQGRFWPHLIITFAHPTKSNRNYPTEAEKRAFYATYRGQSHRFATSVKLAVIPFDPPNGYSDSVLRNNKLNSSPLWSALTPKFWYETKVFDYERPLQVTLEIPEIFHSAWECLKYLEGEDTHYVWVRHHITALIEHIHKYLVADREGRFPIEKLKGLRDWLNTTAQQLHGGGAFSQFIIGVLESFALELVERERLIRCQYCGEYAVFFRGKKYCSINTENKDCQKAATNARDYQRHREKRLKVKKAWIRKTRKEIPGY